MDYRNGGKKSKWILKDKERISLFYRVHQKSMYLVRKSLRDHC